MRLILLISLLYYCYAATVPESQCDLEELGYFITPNKVLGEQASPSCRELGGQLADITSDNMVMVSSSITRCLGHNTRTRIQTWNENSFGTSNLLMTSGAAFGTVHVGTDDEALYALCSRLTDSSSPPQVESSQP